MFKNTIKIIAFSLIATKSFAADQTSYSTYLASFNPSTGIVEIPAITLNGIISYRNVQLKARSDGLFEVAAIGNIDSFSLSQSYNIRSGNLAFSDKGEIVHITGSPDYFDSGSSYDSTEMTEFKFNTARAGLANPEKGSKGTHYIYDADGDIAYATPLGITLSNNNAAYFFKIEMDINEDGDSYSSSEYKTVGDLVIDQNNNIFSITGVSGSLSLNDRYETPVYTTPNKFPNPVVGSKGTYYIIDSYGDIAYLNAK